MPSRVQISVSMMVLLVAAMLVTGCGIGSSKPAPTPTPSIPGPEVIIGQWVRQNRNVDFIGLCQNARQGIDVGKLCVSEAGQRGTLRAYNLGPTFSDPTALAMVQQNPDGTWKLLSVKNIDPSAGNIPGIDWPLEAGDAVVVIGLDPTDCLNVREQPTQKAKAVICVPDGTKAIVQAGPTTAENYTWWQIAGDGFNGWAAGTWLRLQDAVASAYATAVAKAHGAATATPSH